MGDLGSAENLFSRAAAMLGCVRLDGSGAQELGRWQYWLRSKIGCLIATVF